MLTKTTCVVGFQVNFLFFILYIFILYTYTIIFPKFSTLSKMTSVMKKQFHVKIKCTKTFIVVFGRL